MKTHFARTGGQQWIDSFYRPPFTTGNALFADSVNGTAGGTGFSPETATSTMILAQTAATASQGDTVYVAPGHAEAITGAAGMTFSKAGVTYVGLGSGRNRPTITFSTGTDAQMIVSGANITFRNFVFDFTGVSAIVAAISVTGADVAFEDCDFIISTGTNAPVLGILTAATAARFRVERCRATGPATSTDTCTAWIKHEVGINFLFRDNFAIGKFTQAILNATTILGGEITSNRFHIYTGTKAIALAAGTTGVGYNNRITVPSGTAPVVGAGFSWAGNIYTTEALTIGTPTAGAF
jgi:hypothetical protein